MPQFPELDVKILYKYLIPKYFIVIYKYKAFQNILNFKFCWTLNFSKVWIPKTAKHAN